MTQILSLLLAVLAGLALGLWYFGGLWLTVQRLPSARHPGVLSLMSLIIRLGLTLAVFYLVMAGRWERLLACLVGFLLMRTVLVRRLGPVSSQTPGK
jgi:F1F0 ATPase subunit 2